MTELTEALHHEQDPADLANDAVHFSDKLRALAKSSHRRELPLHECELIQAEEAGAIKDRREYE